MKKDMDKKVVIGSIGAVVLLILMPLSTDLGIANPNENQKQDSQLFNTRIKQVIYIKNDQLVQLDYLGKNNLSKFKFPTDRGNQSFLDEFISAILKIDDLSYNRFIVFGINNLQKNSNLKKIEKEKILEIFRSVRNNPDEGIKILINQQTGYKESEILKHTSGCTQYLSCWHYEICGKLGKLLKALVFILFPRVFNFFYSVENCLV